LSKEVKKPYRGFSENGYYIGDHEWNMNKNINGKKLVEWNERLSKIVDNRTDVSLISLHKESSDLSKEILETVLEGFSYDKELEFAHPKELEAAAGNLYAFLYQIGTERESKLLMSLLTETQK
jgi:hypothetical protein